MALITPTTTMMREGATNVSTKVDAGFVGQLNWGLRNNSYKDLVLQHGESIFKLTLLLLQGNEVPDVVYGDREGDKYQHTEGIKLSGRRLPVDIPKSKLVGSSIAKLDPKKQLRDAGYPFDHIGSELIQLDGKFEMVSRDVASLTQKIEGGTKSVVDKIEETKEWVAEHVENIFSEKFIWLVGSLIGGIAVLYANPWLPEDFVARRFNACRDSRRRRYSGACRVDASLAIASLTLRKRRRRALHWRGGCVARAHQRPHR